jgi:hypothetical protein
MEEDFDVQMMRLALKEAEKAVEMDEVSLELFLFPFFFIFAVGSCGMCVTG